MDEVGSIPTGGTHGLKQLRRIMGAQNYHVRNADPKVLETLAEEYQSMGRDTKIEGNTLTVFAYKQVAKKKEDRPRRRSER